MWGRITSYVCVLLGIAAGACGGTDALASVPYEITKTDAEWRKVLTPNEYRVLREQGTEPAFSGDLWDQHGDGVYVCAACGAELYASDTKFESGTGWPSFFEPVTQTAVRRITDISFGMRRVEVVCGRCGGHLGHVFTDGPRPTGERHCINSASLDFLPPADADPRETPEPAKAPRPAKTP